MDAMTKELNRAEIKRHAVCVPKEKQPMFPAIGQTIKITDEQTGSTYDVLVGTQYRLCMRRWYDEHKNVRPGDVIAFRKQDGKMNVSVSPGEGSDPARGRSAHGIDSSSIRKQVLDIAMEVLTGIEDGTIRARIVMKENSFSVEWGDGITDSEVVIGQTRSNI